MLYKIRLNWSFLKTIFRVPYIMNIMVSIDGVIFVNPSEYFIIVAHITSHIPAIIRYIHGFILIISKK